MGASGKRWRKDKDIAEKLSDPQKKEVGEKETRVEEKAKWGRERLVWCASVSRAPSLSWGGVASKKFP